MTNVSITNFRQNIFEYIKSAIDYNEVIDVSTKNGAAVVMSKEDYDSMLETMRLLSVPGLQERFVEALNTPVKECEEFEW